MSQRPQLGSQNSETDVLPTILSKPHTSTKDITSTGHSSQVNIQESSPNTSREVSIQEPPAIIHSRRVSIQEPLPTSHGRRVSTQEPLPTSHGRRVSIQEPLPTSHGRRVSIQEPLPTSHGRRVSIQEPLPTSHGRRVSIQEPLPTSHGRRVSIQEPLPTSHGRRVSIQEPLPTSHGRRVSIQEPLPTSHGRISNLQPPPTSSGCLENIKELLSSPPNLKPLTQEDNEGTQGLSSATRSLQLRDQRILSLNEASFNTSQTTLNHKCTPQISGNYLCINRASFPREIKRSRGDSSFTPLPSGWRLLHEAKRIRRMVSLTLSLAGMVTISLISLGQPWMHFQVPLRPPGDPAGSQTFPINTIFFVRCLDISCQREYDQNAYLLDCAWIFIFISSLSGFCICILLLNSLFSTSSNLPMLDFSLFIISTLTGTSMILGVLFYLLQAQEYLQEGMTYRLGRSFYLAWTGVFFFLMTGFISYMNYVTSWSNAARQSIWA